MSEWRLTTLGRVTTISSGSIPPRQKGAYDVMGANGRIGAAYEANFGPGYLVGRVGAVGVITRVVSRCWASDNTLTVVPNASINEAFLGHMLMSLDLQRLATKTAQPLLIQSELRKQEINLPPFEEQQRIAEVLDTIDETIRATERTITKLTVIARAVQNQILLTGGVRSTTLACIANLYGGNGFPRDEQGRRSGSLPFYKVSDMNSVGNEKFLFEANNYVKPAHRILRGSDGGEEVPVGFAGV